MGARDAVPGGILALDLASVVGWAYGPIGARDPIFGVWQLPYQGGEGARYAAFENELIACVANLAPGQMILEAPLSFQALLGVSNMRVMTQQYTLRGIAYAEGWRASIPVTEIDSFTVRREVLGQGRFAKERVKREVVRYCRGRGWKVPDHNAADACLTWSWLSCRLAGKPPIAGPLFREMAT